MTNLPTYEQILERVKAQNWTHDYEDQNNCHRCAAPFYWEDRFDPCPVRIAQAIQAAMVEALRWVGTFQKPYVHSFDYEFGRFKESADALEKSLKT